MSLHRRLNPTVIGIYAVAVLLVVNIVVMLWKDRSAGVAIAQPQAQPQIAGGAGVYVMPAQVAQNLWGCYLLDVDAGTLCVYQYMPGKHQLELLCARNYKFDRRLENYNTWPPPEEIEELWKKQMAGRKGEN